MGPPALEWAIVEHGTMAGVGQVPGSFVCGLVGPGTSHCAGNGTEQLIVCWCFDK